MLEMFTMRHMTTPEKPRKSNRGRKKLPVPTARLVFSVDSDEADELRRRYTEPADLRRMLRMQYRLLRATGTEYEMWLIQKNREWEAARREGKEIDDSGLVAGLVEVLKRYVEKKP